MKSKFVLVPAMMLALSACATAPRDIAPSYVSASPYQNYTCEQLETEAQNVSAAAAQAIGVQQQKANSDAAMTGVGVIIFWPALFFLKGNGADAANVGQLKGQMQAIQAVSDAKHCGISFQAQQ